MEGNVALVTHIENIRRNHLGDMFLSKFIDEGLKDRKQFYGYDHLNLGNLLISQKDALDKLKAHNWDSEQRICLLHIHTGCGKSGIITVAPYILKPKRYLVISPGLNINNQLFDDMNPNNENNFCYSKNILPRDGKSLPTATTDSKIPKLAICVVNAQKRIQILKLPKDEFDLIAIDEAHHFPAKTWKAIISHFEHARIIFLTATPFRNDGKPVHNLPPIFTFGYHEALRHNMIKKFETMLDVTGDVDDDVDVINEILNKLNYLDTNTNIPHQKAIVYCRNTILKDQINRTTSIKQKFLSNGFNESQISIINYHQGNKNTIKQLIDDFKNNTNKRVAIVNNMLCEGFDCPLISVVAILDPYPTRVNKNNQIRGKKAYIQFVGRAVRRIRVDNEEVQHAHVISKRSLKQQIIHDDYMKTEMVDTDDDDDEEQEDESDTENMDC